MEETGYTLTDKGQTALAEAYWRAKISKEIMEMDLSAAKMVSSDWYAASLRTRMACAAIAAHGDK